MASAVEMDHANERQLTERELQSILAAGTITPKVLVVRDPGQWVDRVQTTSAGWRDHVDMTTFPVFGSTAGIAVGISFGGLAFVVLAIALVHSTFKVVTEYERAVFFRLGRIREAAKGPGIIVKWPITDKVVKVTLRVEVVDIPKQAVITADNVTVQVDAVVYFQVLDPVKAVVGVDDFRFASQRVAMTALRSTVGRHQLDNILAHRDDVNDELRTSIAASTHNWGVEVRQVEIRDIVLPPELLRAMARQAEAERERRAKVIAATGELGASKELAEAAATLYESPGAMQLRTLQTLAEVASENNSTLVFPLPIEILAGFVNGTIGMSSPGAESATVPFPTVFPPSGDGDLNGVPDDEELGVTNS
jgi:regulator of protease activity HflC (stomatin/prohibitin superfamily)